MHEIQFQHLGASDVRTQLDSNLRAGCPHCFLHSVSHPSSSLGGTTSFAVGAALPLLAAIVTPPVYLIPVVAGASLVFLAILGGWAASAGGASVMKGAARVTFWGALAMAVTAATGALFGATP
jgi:VIT1/CCC1 family predicted Fe2+/Mn2+ transporter